MSGGLLRGGAIGRAAERFVETHPRDAARHLERLAPEEVAAFAAELAPDAAAPLFDALNRTFAARCLAALDPSDAAAIVTRAEVRRAAAALRACSKAERSAILEQVDDQTRRGIRRRMRYQAESAAFLADPRYPALMSDVTVGEALERFPVAPTKYLYVCDRDQHLRGVASWRDLANADGRSTLGTVMTQPVVLVSGGTPAAVLRKHPAFVEYDALPVVDEAGTFLGAVTHKTLRDAPGSSRALAPGTGVLTAAELYWRGMGALLAGLVPPRTTGERAS